LKTALMDDQARDRVRALVRDVLKNAIPVEEEQQPLAQPTSSSQPTLSRFIPTVTETVVEKPFARDESSKMVITEDDVRGLEEGARLRVAEGARLTPLAADIVRERKIELVRRVPRRGSGKTKTVAVGADPGGLPMKERLKTFLPRLWHRVPSFGPTSLSRGD